MTFSKQATASGHGWEVWSCWRPRTGYPVGGDLCYAYKGNDKLFISVVDVLGHGEEAHRCAEGLHRVLEERKEDLPGVYGDIERVAARIRGCTLFLGTLDNATLSYIMVGNIRGWVIGDKRLEFLPGQPGVVGGRKLVPVIRNVRIDDYSLVIVCSDGIRRSFVPDRGDGHLWRQDGLYLAVTIIEKYGVPEDDASVLVGRRRT
ncbi:hypothetical protein G7K71_03060 [Desulfofundulus sp. TPOSR]|uniref:hypothetical protein n=1 Tax=Desulfofundulus sp. TPOSR TaxID=2714340 RepID=UPI00140DACD2|nr:hypothetical protein [Desulfofundulus sp. TPOSR]NHM26006.1 hypothetical protein [Desulfofundulus sp. TPOSR]